MKQLLVLSGKGGTGKTTVTSAFIHLLNAKAVADCDVDAPNLHLVLGRIDKPERTIYWGMDKAQIDQSICTGCDKCRALCRFDAIETDKGYRVNGYACEGCGVCVAFCPTHAIALKKSAAGELNLYKGSADEFCQGVFSTAQLKMGSGTSGMLVTSVKKQMLKNANGAEYAIIDGSPGIGCPVIASVSGVDWVLLVAEPSLSGISDMKRLVKTANAFGVVIAVCTNKYDVNRERTKEIERFCLNEDIAYVGRIPYDPLVVTAVNQGQSIAELDSPAGIAVRDVFDRMYELMSIESA